MFSVLQEEGFAASEKQRYKAASDDKCKVTCAGDDKPDVTDLVRAHLQQSRERHDQPEFSPCTIDQVQGLKFQVNCFYYISVTFIKQTKF